MITESATEDPSAPYKQSLFPTFQGDIAALGEIPRCRIVVSLDAGALTLTGRQQTFYTNNVDRQQKRGAEPPR